MSSSQPLLQPIKCLAMLEAIVSRRSASSQSLLQRFKYFANLVCFATFLIVSGCESKATNETHTAQPTQPATGTVTVTFNYVDAPSETVQLPNIAENTSVLALMQMIESPVIVIQGSGINSLVTQIGDLKESSSEGWTYYVNGKWADQGIGSATISPGDEIQWRYGDWSSSQE